MRGVVLLLQALLFRGAVVCGGGIAVEANEKTVYSELELHVKRMQDICKPLREPRESTSFYSSPEGTEFFLLLENKEKNLRM